VKFWIIIGLIIFSCSFTYAEEFNNTHNFYPFNLNFETKTVHTNNFSYSLMDSGLISIEHANKPMTNLGIALYGEVGGTPFFLKGWNTTWNWQTLNNSKEEIKVQGSTTYSDFDWNQVWDFNSNGKMKLFHLLKNQTNYDILNSKIYYVLDVNSDLINSITYFNDLNETKTFVFGSQDFEFEGNLNLSNGKIIFNSDKNSFFYFTDLFVDFNVMYLFAGNLKNVVNQLPDSNGVIIGFSKGNGTIKKGMQVLIDPTFDDFEDNDYSGSWGYSESENNPLLAYGVEQDGYLELKVAGSIYEGLRTNMYGYFLLNDANSLILRDFPLDIYYSIHINVGESGSGASNGTNTIYLSDGTNDVNIFDYRADCSDCGADVTHPLNDLHFKMTLTNTDGNNIQVDLNTGESFIKSLTPLDVSNIRFKFHSISSIVASGGGDAADSNVLIRIYQIDDDPVDLNLVNPNNSGIYLKGGSIYSIDFNVSSGDANAVDQNFDLNYGLTSQADIVILNDGNVAKTIGLYCDSNNLEFETQCHYSWNVPVLDSNYFVKVFMSDGTTDVNDSSDNSFVIDSTAPSTSWDGNHNSWQNFDANIHLTCNDGTGSGCSGGDANTIYRLDSDSSNSISYGSWLTYDKNILIFLDGNYAIDFNSTDRIGNIGDVNTFYVLVDKNSPDLTNVLPPNNSSQTTTTFTFSVNVIDSNSGATQCDYNVFYNNLPYLTNQTDTIIANECSTTFIYTSTDDVLFVTWSVQDLAGNRTDLNSYTNKYIPEGGGDVSGGGGGVTFIEVETQKVFSIIKPETSTLIFNVYPEYRKFDTFKLQNDLDTNQLLIITVSEEIYPYLKFDENNSIKEFEFQGLETKQLLYEIYIPPQTQIGKYFGTIELQDANRTTEIKVTINVTEKPFYAFLTEWLQDETDLGLIAIPNIILIIIGGIITYFLFLQKQQEILNLNFIKNALK